MELRFCDSVTGILPLSLKKETSSKNNVTIESIAVELISH